ncbi:DMT family transporter [Neobacillus drentensis]|uniref:DMT family transporter n=1 Tax=Neobacillus drentensis TaxID=220684 RepID=UPI003000DBD6
MNIRNNRILFGLQSLTILLWGSAFSAIRVGLEGYSPEHLSLIRLLVGSVVLLIFGFLFRIPLPELKDTPAIFLFGGLGFTIYYIALNYGEQTVSAGSASLFVSTTPIFAAFLGLIFFRQRFGLRRWFGVILGFIGVALVSSGTGDSFQLSSGIIFILLASLSESVYFTFQKKYIEKYGFLAFTSYTIWAGTILMFIYLPGLSEEIVNAPHDATLSVIFLGVFPTVVPYLTLAYITTRVDSSESTLSFFLIPATTFIVSWIWLGEVPTLLSIFGGIITLMGVIVSTMKELIAKKIQSVNLEP